MGTTGGTVNEEDLKTTLTRVAHRAQQDPAALDRIKTGRHRREVRRRTITATSAVATVAALAFAATQLLPGGADDPGSFATDPPGTPTGAPTDPYRARTIAYVTGAGGVRTFDVATGEPGYSYGFGADTRPTHVHLGSDGWLYVVADSGPGRSRLTAHEQATYCPNGTDERCLPPRTEVIDTVGGRIGAIAWDGQGSFAYLASGDPDATLGQHVLYLDRGDGAAVPLWTFPGYLGRGTNSDDELQVEFSPDGSKILVVNTFVDTAQERQDETLLVFDLDGNQVVPARNGTHARWSTSGTIFYLPIDPSDDTWRELNVDTGEETELAISLPGATNPALSPDGRSLAIEDEGSNSITILDLEDGSTETMPGAAPLWFDADTLLVTELEDCRPDLCEVLPWMDTGRVLKIDVGETSGEPYAVESKMTTRGASVLYGMAG